MIIWILMLIILSITWFISTLPFLIPYQILLTYQSKKNGYKLSIEHIVIVSIFVYYLAGVLSFTGIPTILRDIVHNSFGIITPTGLNILPDEINLIPFRWITEGVRTYIENILLFIPLGFMLPCIWKKYEVLWKTALSGFTFSLLIELCQLFNRNRVTDLDDLLMNTLGALIGWVIFRLLKERLSKLQDKISVQSTKIERRRQSPNSISGGLPISRSSVVGRNPRLTPTVLGFRQVNCQNPKPFVQRFECRANIRRRRIAHGDSNRTSRFEKIPLLLREEACFYMAIAFAGMFFVYNPMLICPFLRSLFN